MTDYSGSCTVQHLAQREVATSEWAETRVIAEARRLNAGIVASETSVTVDYWYLGRALNVLRELARYGDWESFLSEHGIEKTRAHRARRIAKLFDSPDQLEGLTVQQACQSHRERESRPSTEKPLIERLIRSLKTSAKLCRQLDQDTELMDEESLGSLQEATRICQASLQSILEIWGAEEPEDALGPTVDSQDRSY